MAAIARPPEVYHLGSAYEEYYAYTDAEAITQGDLVRLTTSGTIKLADADTDTTGAVTAIALEDGTTGGDVIKVLMLAPDTQIKIQCYGTVEPEDLTAGVSYTLDVTTGSQSVTSTTTKGIATVVKTAGLDTPWTGPTNGGFDESIGTDNNCVIVRFAAAILDGRGAA